MTCPRPHIPPLLTLPPPARPRPALPADQRWEGPTEASGERAGRVLPSCFALLEACVEALAVDTQVGLVAAGAHLYWWRWDRVVAAAGTQEG